MAGPKEKLFQCYGSGLNLRNSLNEKAVETVNGFKFHLGKLDLLNVKSNHSGVNTG